MRIAFYAPLKSPDHPVPSGDRLMARMLRAALGQAGHLVELASDLRSYLRDPDDQVAAAAIAARAADERQRIAADWGQDPPQVWLTYHPYYKSPDLIGPPLARAFGLPYLTVEASYSPRRSQGVWAGSQAEVLAALRQAAVNICLTARDRAGIALAAPRARLADLPPFIDPAPYLGPRLPHDGPVRLITVAMMRAGDKMDSYRMLAEALNGLQAPDWRLTIVGAGPMEAEVRALFARLADRVTWAGLRAPAEVADLLRQSDLYLWPGSGEAYGLAYLEAQAAGLAVVAQAVAGVPEVVRDVLTPAGDVAAYRAAVVGLIADPARREQLGQAARARVLARHSFQAATARLQAILTGVTESGA